MSENNSNEWHRIGCKRAVIPFTCLLVSLIIHELGHAIALNLLGIPTTFICELRNAGPVLGVKFPYLPSTELELAFVIIAGPGLAAIVFVLLGRFWRIDCYVAAAFQACYVPFELLSWILGIGSGNEITTFFLFLAIVPIPCAIIIDRVFDRIGKETK